MNENILIILGILLFAIATSILYMIGLKKKMNENKELADKLLNNAALKIISYLKENDNISMDEIANIIKGVKAKNFYSRKTAIITDSKEFKHQLVSFMLENNYLSETRNSKGRKVYKLYEKSK